MPGKSKLLMRNPAERLISLTVRLPLWIRSVGNAVNLLMTILICSHSILVTSG
ncbi:Mobile element protein [Klebsiella pneumoniae IS46]|nr:Mobile element protein [Klebsiella pneumoniae IS46]